MNNLNALAPTPNREIVAQQITAEMFDRFTRFLRGSMATKQTYTRAIKQFFVFLQTQGITTPTWEDLNNYRAWVVSHTDKDGKEVKHAPATVQLYTQAVRLFFQWLEAEGLYPNIATHLEGAKIDRNHKRDYFTAGQIKNILGTIDTTTIKGKRDFAIIALTATTGVRDIEIVRANIEDLATAGGNPVLYVQGKGKEERADFVKLPEPTERAIRDYLKARGHADPEDPLFTGTGNRNNGGRLTTRSISRMGKGYMKAAGYDSNKLSFHSFRHSAVTIALLQGQTIDEVQQFARHANIATTMIYNHRVQRENNQCSQAVAEAIF